MKRRVLKYEEWEKKIKERIEENKKLKRIYCSHRKQFIFEIKFIFMSLSLSQKQKIRKLDPDDISFLAHFDILTVRILQKFYGMTIDPVNGDINTFDVQRLHKLLYREGLKITVEGLRKKLELLVKLGFLEKINTYPRLYLAVREIEKIKKIQTKIVKLKKILT